jgi:hypothetical protein
MSEKVRRRRYQGKLFPIPEGYNYIVADNDGKVYAYVDPPIWNVNRLEWHDNGAGTMKHVGWLPVTRYEVKEIK